MNIIRRNATTVLHLVIISVLGMLIYSNTLTASFQFDDKLNIVDNPLIRDLRNLWPPSGARWFGFFTFSLNYAFGGLNPVGYHLVNLSIHILAALSVYLFVLLTFRTPYFANHTFTIEPKGWFAFACALLFVAHPIQTQAVTYVVQRFASLAAMLFMLSLDAYILARLIGTSENRAGAGSRFHAVWIRMFLYTAAGLAALLGMKTKENAWTLPVMVCLYDVMFISSLSGLRQLIRKQWRAVAAIASLAAFFLVFVINKYGLHDLLDRLKATNEITRHDYLITQFRVIATYLRLLFFPVNQTIDYHYKVYSNALDPEIITSAALIALILAAALYLCKFSRHSSPYVRLVSFGIFWFFITLSIESGFIPIIDVIFEHRLYLPSVGVFIAITSLSVLLLERMVLYRTNSCRYAAGMFAIVILVLSCASYARNGVWKTELSLWSDVIDKRPENPRGYNMVGSYYQANFRIYDAIGYFRKALAVDSSYAEARSNLGNAYIQIGRLDEGLNELMITAGSNRFDAIDTGILYYNIGKAYYAKDMPDLAIQYLNQALRFIPNEAAVFFLLGEASKRKNLPEQASVYLKKAHELDPLKY